MKNSKKGSSAVFLMVILASLISITLALIYSSRQESIKSYADAVINLAGDSIMSEYDYHVQKEYGLFLIKGTDDLLSQKLRNYINYSLKDMGDVNIESVKVSAAGYSIADVGLVKEQIMEYMKYAETAGVMKEFVYGKEQQAPSQESRTLRHGPTIASLPSAKLPSKSLTALAESIADKTGDIEGAFASGTENYLLNRYILTHFNSRNHGQYDNHFFQNEVEYVLGGELSDRKNEKRVEMALKAMRFPLNLAHIYADPKKREALMAMAQVMTPGAAAIATQTALASTWAYAEADNDVELLWQGYKVPVVKAEENWAMDLDSAVEGIFGGTAKPAVEKGYCYDEYLQILLFFQDENTKLARILDLIQINMRKNYNSDFLIQEYSTGINVKVKINGETYGYEKQY